MNYWPPLKIGICGDRFLLMCPSAPPDDRNGHGTDDDDDDRADNLIFFRILSLRESSQQLPKVSCSYLHGKLDI